MADSIADQFKIVRMEEDGLSVCATCKRCRQSFTIEITLLDSELKKHLACCSGKADK